MCVSTSTAFLLLMVWVEDRGVRVGDGGGGGGGGTLLKAASEGTGVLTSLHCHNPWQLRRPWLPA